MERNHFRNCILVLWFITNSFGYSGTPSTSLRQASLEIDKRNSGDGQYEIVNKQLDHPIVVRVLQDGAPLANTAVYFSIVSAPSKSRGQELSETVVRTDKEGFAATSFTTGSRYGEFIVSAKIETGSPESNEVFFHVYARQSNWVFLLIMGLLGGLGLFLYGMEMMSEGMKKSAGNKMRTILERLTTNRVIGLLVGALVTMTIQSSSATTVLLVSFVHAGLMQFIQALGVILGAGIGTTITAQLIAFKIADYALIMVALGVSMYMFSSKDIYKHLGEIFLGFGMLFYGMHLMSEAMYPLRTHEAFLSILSQLENPIYGIIVGAIFTALIQSSSAFTGIIIVLAIQGVLSLEAGIPLIFGANIGTCITAGLASINASRDAKRVALAHVGYKILGVLIFVFWIPYFADIIRMISPVSDLEGAAKMAAETPRQIANAHTFFNVSIALIFLPFTTQFSKIIYKVLPVRKEIVDEGLKPKVYHLDENMVKTPAIAIDLVMAEIATITQLLRRMLSAIIELFTGDSEKQDMSHENLSLIEGIHMREEKIDFLKARVSDYLVLVSRQKLDDEQAKEVFGLMSVVNDMENIGDIVEQKLLPLAQSYLNGKYRFSKEGIAELNDYHLRVIKQVSRMGAFFSKFKRKRIAKIITKDIKYTEMERAFRRMHIKRVQKEKLESVATHDVHMEIMDMFRQINGFISNIARTLMSIIPEQDVEMTESNSE